MGGRSNFRPNFRTRTFGNWRINSLNQASRWFHLQKRKQYTSAKRYLVAGWVHKLLSKYACSTCFPWQNPLGNELILRIRIPDTQQLLLDPKKRKEYASEQLNDFTQNEIDVLTKLTKDGCSSAPRLISWMREKQSKKKPVTGGYIVYSLMKKLPGVHPLDLWVEELFSKRDRDEIRRAFREAMRCQCLPFAQSSLRVSRC